jgi:two-component sensor histidine kinase
MPKLAHPAWLTSSRRPTLILELAVASAAIASATGLRFFIDLFFRDVVLFPLVFPALAGATLFAGWRCGLMVIFGCQALVWYFLLPVRGSFKFTSASDAMSLLLATAAQLLMLWFISRYRAAQGEARIALESQREALDRALARLESQSETDRLLREQEAALRATRQNLEAIYQASGDGLALCEVFRDAEGHVVEYQAIEVNRAHAELTGATREQMLTLRVSMIAPPIDPRWFETAETVLNTGVMHDFDIRSPATGRWLNIRVSRVSDNLIQQTFIDISNRYKLEEQRQALLKEMSHRVMNNFQMIAGFLQMGAARADPFAKEQLNMAQRRIQVLAKLHSLLAYSESGGDINAGAYVEEICRHLASTLERPEAVTIVCETRDILMPSDKVVPLGFVVAELVTNSAKYAYPAPMTGKICVSLLPLTEGWVLTVEDEGIGLGRPEPKEAGGLGTLLVRRFVQQIGAQLITTSNNGTRHQINLGTAAWRMNSAALGNGSTEAAAL